MPEKSMNEQRYDNLLGQMSWYVLATDASDDVVKQVNIFNSWKFRKNVISELKEKGKTKEEFVNSIRVACRDFRSRYQYEILASSLSNQDKTKKIDIYSQLEPNMERLAEYIAKETGYRLKK